MGIQTKMQAAIPDGRHTGVIVDASLTTKTFDQKKGPEETVEIIIQPEWEADDGRETLSVNVLFSPSLNGLSALSRFLNGIDAHPNDGEEWEPEELVGTRVTFTSFVGDNGFVSVNKNTIKLAPDEE